MRSQFEVEIQAMHDAMRARMDDIAERVRLDEIARRYVEGNHEIRTGDFVRFSDGHATRVSISRHDGRWTFTDRNGHHIEHFRIPPEPLIERLYTIPEVGEIVAKVARGPSELDIRDRRPIAIRDVFDDGYWRPCSGCHTPNVGHATGPWSEAFRCNVGDGCHECGGIGVIWERFEVGVGG
jgi:hypothetical protein